MIELFKDILPINQEISKSEFRTQVNSAIELVSNPLKEIPKEKFNEMIDSISKIEKLIRIKEKSERQQKKLKEEKENRKLNGTDMEEIIKMCDKGFRYKYIAQKLKLDESRVKNLTEK